MESRAPISERIFRALLVMYSEECLQCEGAPMLETYRDMYRDARGRGRLALVWMWLRYVIPDFASNVFEDRRERGQCRELAVVSLVFTLVLTFAFYSLTALAGSIASLLLVGVHVAELSSIPGSITEEHVVLIVGNTLTAAMFVGMAWGAKRFAYRIYSEGLDSEHV